MELVGYKEIFEAVCNTNEEWKTEMLNSGLIHRTWKIKSQENHHCLLLQRINTHVFRNPGMLADNYQNLYEHLQEKNLPVIMPKQVSFHDGKYLYQDSENHHWRLFEFIDGFEELPPFSISHARELGRAFGQLLVSFHQMDTSSLHATIPGFHDLGERFDQFQTTATTVATKRRVSAAEEISQLLSRERYVKHFRELTAPGQLPLRIFHHDAKPSNVLTDQQGEIKSILDFDTTMPGYIFSDVGDLVRSILGQEDEIGFSGIINPDLYHSILDGYLEESEHILSSLEKKHIHFSGIVMTYMQALRFLEDYLSGDRYYKTSYPTQNLDRAKNQLELLIKLEQFFIDNNLSI